jgi:hypothetical protein
MLDPQLGFFSLARSRVWFVNVRLILLKGNLLKPGNPLIVDQLTTNNQPPAEELKKLQ